MIEVRKKDLVFVGVVLPVALVGAYVWLWRIPAAEKVAALVERSAALVEEDDFPRRMDIARRQTELAEAALEKEKSIPPPETKMLPAGDARLPERQRELFARFATCGMRIVSSKAMPQEKSPVRDALAKAAAPEGCVRLDIVAEGTYPALRAALASLDESRAAVIPQGVAFSAAAPNRWEISVWL